MSKTDRFPPLTSADTEYPPRRGWEVQLMALVLIGMVIGGVFIIYGAAALIWRFLQ